MAKIIRSLTPAKRKINRLVNVNIKTNSKINSYKGKRSKEESNRRIIKNINIEGHKRPALRALKKKLGSKSRDRKAILPANIFAGKTPKQIKRICKRHANIQSLIDFLLPVENKLENIAA